LHRTRLLVLLHLQSQTRSLLQAACWKEDEPGMCAQVRARDDEGAMGYGRAVLVRAVAGPEDAELLQDALSLLGYEDPAASPCGALLSSRVRWLCMHAGLSCACMHEDAAECATQAGVAPCLHAREDHLLVHA
jgi:hypothetical protein